MTLKKALGITLRFGDLEVKDCRGYHFSFVPSSLDGCRLDEVAFRSLLEVKATNFRGVSFYEADLSQFKLCGLDFSHAIFNNVRLPDLVSGCKLQGTTINGDLGKTRFEGCDLLFLNFTGARNLSNDQVVNNKDWQKAHYFNKDRVIFGGNNFVRSLKSYAESISGDANPPRIKTQNVIQKRSSIKCSKAQFSVQQFVNSHPSMQSFAKLGEEKRRERIAQKMIGRSRAI